MFSQPFYYKAAITENDKLVEINCFTAISSLFSRLIHKNNESLGSISIEKSCQNCQIQIKRTLPIVPLDLRSLNGDLKHLDNYILRRYENVTFCDQCSNQMIVVKKYGNILAFDVEPYDNFSRASKICEIEEIIVMDEKNYELFAVIEHKQLGRHFIAHVRRLNNRWDTYDDLDTKVKSSVKTPNVFMYPFMVFYITT